MHVVFNMNVFKESNVCVFSSSYQMKLEISANYIIYSNIFNVFNIISNSFFFYIPTYSFYLITWSSHSQRLRRFWYKIYIYILFFLFLKRQRMLHLVKVIYFVKVCQSGFFCLKFSTDTSSFKIIESSM